jgi:hypothetical protein
LCRNASQDGVEWTRVAASRWQHLRDDAIGQYGWYRIQAGGLNVEPHHSDHAARDRGVVRWRTWRGIIRRFVTGRGREWRHLGGQVIPFER